MTAKFPTYPYLFLDGGGGGGGGEGELRGACLGTSAPGFLSRVVPGELPGVGGISNSSI